METKDIQIILASAGYYNGGIDGIIGQKTLRARSNVEMKHDYSTALMSDKRRWIAAAQAALNELGFEAGTPDGYVGNNTREAMRAFMFKIATGRKEVIARTPRLMRPGAPSSEVPHQSEVRAFYGDPETQVPNHLTQIQLPFKLRIDWNLNQRTNKITVHEKCGPSLLHALIEVHDTYGVTEMRRLGIDRYAGAYNKRRMRGGTAWSMHAYGCAIDFYAAPNGLRMRCPEALFCRSEYEAFLDIMEKHGWLPALRLWGADAMHFQRAVV